MVRRIVKIDEEKCNGCGLCAEACHEGAIGIINGKAKLLRDDYCDGLGDCLPACPVDAIGFEEREAAAYDEKAVEERKAAAYGEKAAEERNVTAHAEKTVEKRKACLENMDKNSENCACESRLSTWPVQMKLAPIQAPYFADADLLIAADCTAYAYGDFHNRFIKNRVTLIGCPKLDSGDYSEKLTEIMKNNTIKSVTVVRMQVPCCGKLENAVKRALNNSGKEIPCEVLVISTNGRLLV
ncbi:MAG: 4Fe-4S binding protein [Lachnospiraceae bacterium]|nr:4Fe-4S binding protein [Lachnospiraceae bacterium]